VNRRDEAHVVVEEGDLIGGTLPLLHALDVLKLSDELPSVTVGIALRADRPAKKASRGAILPPGYFEDRAPVGS
jgi:hypothetical protein